MSFNSLANLEEHLRGEAPRKWLVTGAAGFIGSHCAASLLRAGQSVVALDNFATGYQKNIDYLVTLSSNSPGEFEFVEADICDLLSCKQKLGATQIIIHQAALGSVPRSIDDPIATHRANVDGFVNLLDFARVAGIKRFVYASSSSVYGDDPSLPKKEAELGQALSPYAVSKRVNELYALNFSKVYGLETVGLRYFNVFGPRQDPNGAYAAVIPKWVARLVSGEACEIYGDGETSRDFCFIDNVVQANVLAGISTNPDALNCVYNVAAGETTSLNSLFEQITKALFEMRAIKEIPKPIYKPFRAGDIRHSLADFSAIASSLDYQVLVTVAEGIPQTVESFVG